ncbi:MAG: thioredoxin TrxC [Burkholderiales bacterium]|nr:thioredoxin TrxC [Burkholderiales bacterium]
MNATTTHAPAHIACAACGAVNRVPADRLADDPDCGRCHRPLLDGRPLVLDERNFDAVVQGSTIPVLVDFWAPWCGPCRMMAPMFEQAARQLKGRVLLAKVNSDEAPGLASRFAIRSIPTLVRLDGGRETARRSGALPTEQIVTLARG